jgi:hypothetical protein
VESNERIAFQGIECDGLEILQIQGVVVCRGTVVVFGGFVSPTS